MAVQQDFRTNRADYLIATKAIMGADGVGAKKTSSRIYDPTLAKLAANPSKSSPAPVSRDRVSELFPFDEFILKTQRPGGTFKRDNRGTHSSV